MKERIITAICLMLVAVPCVIFGGYYFKGLIGVILALAVYEMLHICTRPKIKMYLYPIVCGFFIYGFLFDQDDLFLASYGILIYLIVLFGATIFDDTLTIERTSYIFTMGVLICAGLHALMSLRDVYGFQYIFKLSKSILMNILNNLNPHIPGTLKEIFSTFGSLSHVCRHQHFPGIFTAKLFRHCI